MVFGHNLQHMAPFGIPTTDSGMVVQCATLIFSTPRLIFATQYPRFGPQRVPAGPGTFLSQKWGPNEDGFAEEGVPHGG